MAETGNVYNLT